MKQPAIIPVQEVNSLLKRICDDSVRLLCVDYRVVLRSGDFGNSHSTPHQLRVNLKTGESGTGKELVAREIHARSSRHARPLIKVNCAAIPRELYESDFFGHTKGSFTGSVRDRVGRFQ